MLKSLKKCINSLPNSAKTTIIQLKTLKKVVNISKRNKNKRVFSGFKGLKSSFGSMEFSNQLELVFKFIDANDDGKISSNELCEFLMCIRHDKSNNNNNNNNVVEEAHEMLKCMDVNGDGFVDLNEYMNVMLSDDDNNDNDNDYNGNNYDNYDDLENEIIRDAFHVFDIDKNGLIDAKDLKHVLKKLGFANCGIKECNLMIKGVDMDGDGFVNFDEFKLMMAGVD